MIRAHLASRILLPLYDRLAGHRLWRELCSLRIVQWRSPDELEARAAARLRDLARHAVAHVPHYRELFAEAGIGPDDLRSTADLARLPISTKGRLRAGFPQRVTDARLLGRRGWPGRTSGSTGLAFHFYLDRADLDMRRAGFLLFREWAGAPLGSTMLWIGGHRPPVAPGPEATLRRLLLGDRGEALAGAGVSPAQFTAWARRLRGARYFIWAYPSYASRLARRLLAEGRPVEHRPDVVLSYSETLTPADAAAMASAFRCPVADYYSTWEVHAIAQTCPDHPPSLHVNSERVIVRVVREDGAPARAGERGRVVLTDLTNQVMPFLNYDVGDHAVVGPPCPCGRGFPTLLALEGRSAETLSTLDGRVLAPSTLGWVVVEPPPEPPTIWEFQAVQTRPDAVTLRVVPTERFTPAAAAATRRRVEALLGPGMRLDMETADRIEPEPSGKRLVIKSLPGPSAPA